MTAEGLCTVDGRPWPGIWGQADPTADSVFLLWRHTGHRTWQRSELMGVFGSAESARECAIYHTPDAVAWERSGFSVISKRISPCNEHAEWRIERRNIIDPVQVP